MSSTSDFNNSSLFIIFGFDSVFAEDEKQFQNRRRSVNEMRGSGEIHKELLAFTSKLLANAENTI